MKIQKIFQAGNSQVVAIPRHMLDDVGIRPGESVVVEKATNNAAIIIKKASKKDASSKKSSKTDAEFQKWWKSFVKENGGILDDLA